jgi:hypothetical protein
MWTLPRQGTESKASASGTASKITASDDLPQADFRPVTGRISAISAWRHPLRTQTAGNIGGGGKTVPETMSLGFAEDQARRRNLSVAASGRSRWNCGREAARETEV